MLDGPTHDADVGAPKFAMLSPDAVDAPWIDGAVDIFCVGGKLLC